VIIEPGVYRDRPTGAILLILGATQLGPIESDADQNSLEMIQLVVLLGDDVEWREEGVIVMCQEFTFDDSTTEDGTCLERIT